MTRTTLTMMTTSWEVSTERSSLVWECFVDVGICTDLGDVVMLAGGHDGFHILDSVELYSPNGTCQHNLAPLPAPAYGLVLAYVEALVSTGHGHFIAFNL